MQSQSQISLILHILDIEETVTLLKSQVLFQNIKTEWPYLSAYLFYF